MLYEERGGLKFSDFPTPCHSEGSEYRQKYQLYHSRTEEMTMTNTDCRYGPCFDRHYKFTRLFNLGQLSIKQKYFGVFMNNELILTELDKAILEEANTGLTSFQDGEHCTMNTLMSEAFLESFHDVATFIGRRLSFLVSFKLLPLELVGRTNSNHNQYIVKRSNT